MPRGRKKKYVRPKIECNCQVCDKELEYPYVHVSLEPTYFVKRDKNDPPAFTTNKWVSLEISYNLSSTQRISVLYGSIQGGLVCSNGVCRVLQPFNDGLKITYSAIL